ncbi:hypothetical protein ACW2QC_09460 [Virgibacillus sp. FSP13]
MENLYKEEQKLLDKLVNSKSREQQEAIKRTIGRINEEMRSIEDINPST